MTHIESTLPEIVGSEVVGLSLRDADGLAAAALYDLVRKATGCRLPQPDGTPSSEVEELLALCSAVLRRHWQTPLTMLDGLSLQDLVSRLMADRMLEGDATLSIPAVNGSVTEALSALLERKITGAPEVADGVSLVQLLCGSAASASLTTLTDPTTGWTMDKALLISQFPNVTEYIIGCESITAFILSATNATFTLRFRDCKTISDINLTGVCPNVSVYFDSMEVLNQRAGNGGITTFWVGYVYLPVVKSGRWRLGDNASHFNSTTKYVFIGCKGEKSETVIVSHNYLVNTSVTDVEVGDGACQNISIVNVNGLTEENIYNHILCRLKQDEAMCGEGVTITLGTTNLDKLTSAESVALLAELRDTYGYTFA